MSQAFAPIKELRNNMPARSQQRTILIVDDDPMTRRLIEVLIEQAGHRPITADSGATALEQLQAHKSATHAVLLDRDLPDSDGLQVMRRIRAVTGEDYIPVILVTGKTEEHDVVTGFDAGADDYLTKPIRKPELAARLRSALRIRDMAADIRQRAQKLQEELREARDLQQTTIPSESKRFGRSRCASIYRPCTYVSGDTCNYIPLGNDQLSVYVADVSGHGVAAAMLAMWVNQTLHPQGYDDSSIDSSDPVEVCYRLDAVVDKLSCDRYLTLVFAQLDVSTGVLRYCCAGHPHPILLRACGTIEILDLGGPPVGMSFGMPYESASITLETGDRLFLYSDAIVEAQAPDGRMFGEERFREALFRHRDKDLEAQLNAVVAEAMEFQGCQSFEDDLTLLAIEFLASESES